MHYQFSALNIISEMREGRVSRMWENAYLSIENIKVSRAIK